MDNNKLIKLIRNRLVQAYNRLGDELDQISRMLEGLSVSELKK